MTSSQLFPIFSISDLKNHQISRVKASHFREQFRELRNEIRKRSPCFESILDNTDSSFVLMEQFFATLADFTVERKPINVEIGYHYTAQDSLASIQQNGFNTNHDRRSFYGKGIFVANNPHAFKSYGSTGIIVLVIPGVKKWCLYKESNVDPGVDSLAGNKLYGTSSSFFHRSQYFDELVTRNGRQVLPLISFQREIENNHDLLWDLHKIIDGWVHRIFPSGWPQTDPKRILPDYEDIRYEHVIAMSSIMPSSQLVSINPAFTFFATQKTLQPKPPSSSLEVCDSCSLQAERKQCGLYYREVNDRSGDREKQECAICFDALKTETTVSIKACGHLLHKTCLDTWFKHNTSCPICRACLLAEPIGYGPSGTLEILVKDHVHCGDYSNTGTIQLTYSIPEGIQTTEHENPGQPYPGTIRKAFVPDTREGRKLVKRLRYAFRRGLTFKVGTSLTTGQSSVICWASIHHKTHCTGESHGWPDPSYFTNCNKELDNLRVPKASDL